jgi:hypothetical protein
MSTVTTRPLTDRAQDSLRRAGNPFCNYFARNPDDEVCARYHVPELYAREREQLWALVDLYRYQPGTHSEIVPILGNKGAGKTHLLHSIKHGGGGAWQLLVTPGTYQRDSEFLEYLLFQIIDTLLGGGKQRGVRPLQFVGVEVVRRLLTQALTALTPEDRLELFPMPLFGRWAKRLGLGASQAGERTQYLLDSLNAAPKDSEPRYGQLLHHLQEVNLEPARACQLVCDFVQRTAAHNTAGLMRRHILQGFARAVLLNDEAELASFLTYGFAELEFHVRPTRQDLVLALFKVLMGVFLELKMPVVVAFDQLEDLLLARRSGDAHQVAESFFAGIVQAMHQIDGVCFLVFAERGLWNRFVPSLDGYIQDRLNNPIHLPGHGTIQTLKLEAPPAELVRKVVEARLRPVLDELPPDAALPAIFPFSDEQVDRVARTEPTLRDGLQQFRRLYDRLVFGTEEDAGTRGRGEPANRLADEVAVKSVVVVESPGEALSHASPDAAPAMAVAPRLRVPSADLPAWRELWDREWQAAQQQLRPDGGLTGATRELQAGLGDFLKTCHEHGVKVGPWRLQHVVGEFSFSEHPTYGVLTLAHWAIKDGQPWKVGIGLFLARGNAKPKDLEIKLGSFEVEPAVVDHLILLRPEEDLGLTGKSKTLWADAEKKGRHARLEPVSLDTFASLYAFPRWLAAVTESLSDGQPLPNLADFIQDRCDKLLEQVCMPVQGGF